MDKKILKKKQKRTDLFAYAMLAPDLIGLSLFIFVPIIMAFVVSLHSWDALSSMKFIGFSNYLKLISDKTWWLSLRITLSYAVIYVSLVYALSLILAVFINSLNFGQELFRTIYFIPFSVSTVVAGMIWLFIYNDKTGYINSFLVALGFDPFKFLTSTKEALPSIAITTTWMSVGYYTIIFLAAIKDIPMCYYEAARLDGAGALRQFIHITFPLVREVSAFVLIITSINSFQVFDQIKIMTNGGPAGSTNVTVFYIYRQSFEFMKLGYSSSLAFALFLIIFSISLIQLRITGVGRKSSKDII